MADIDAIYNKISSLYRLLPEDDTPIPLELRSGSMGLRAKDYICAAAIIENNGFQHYLPQIQLTGQAVELALKSCIASVGIEPPRGYRGHDLVALYRTVQAHGFEIEEREFAAIVHLNHIFFEDLSTDTRYKSRYPADNNENLGGVVPKNEVYDAIVKKLVSLSKVKNGAA